ncbi:ATP-binding cassette domain-containing protein [Halosquirtibacter xylanolyticus]|uniref:cell division ATP-binding protein FtsE n=1 Tax=Halosquirtibacter xylanolyticus TaxID=3374599 RepID=UPI003748B2AE|nr:ATP-binding cassette domain-containing protein [Prolixibacteraceae bacterium]
MKVKLFKGKNNHNTLNMERLLKIENASFQQKENIILTDVNLEVYRNDFIYIIGKVGTGKTTIFQSIYGSLPYKQGSIIFDGAEVKQTKKKNMYLHRRKIGMIFQDFHLLDDRTVAQNLEFVLRATGWTNKQTIANHINMTLEWCDIKHLGQKYSNELSGGEKNLASIARAIINNPKLIIADEPTQNLDPETAIKQMQLLNRINQDGTAIIMATHNHNIIDMFPKETYECVNKTLVLR